MDHEVFRSLNVWIKMVTTSYSSGLHNLSFSSSLFVDPIWISHRRKTGTNVKHYIGLPIGTDVRRLSKDCLTTVPETSIACTIPTCAFVLLKRFEGFFRDWKWSDNRKFERLLHLILWMNGKKIKAEKKTRELEEWIEKLLLLQILTPKLIALGGYNINIIN